jgi:hypothetical protein
MMLNHHMCQPLRRGAKMLDHDVHGIFTQFPQMAGLPVVPDASPVEVFRFYCIFFPILSGFDQFLCIGSPLFIVMLFSVVKQSNSTAEILGSEKV